MDMMRSFPKVLLRWKEPKALQQAGHREGKRSLARMIAVIVPVSLVLIWLVHRFAGEATGRISAALVLVILFLYFCLWVYKVFPSCVEVSETGISQSVTSEDEETWNFEDIGHCEIGTTDVDGRTLRVLVIETRQGDRSTLGLADSVSTEDLRAVLARKGLQVITTPEPGSAGAGSQTR